MKQHEEPDPRGYVFIDIDGDAWGYAANSDSKCRCKRGADQPFQNIDEAKIAGEKCIFGCVRVEVWTPECGVAPMTGSTT